MVQTRLVALALVLTLGGCFNSPGPRSLPGDTDHADAGFDAEPDVAADAQVGDMDLAADSTMDSGRDLGPRFQLEVRDDGEVTVAEGGAGAEVWVRVVGQTQVAVRVDLDHADFHPSSVTLPAGSSDWHAISVSAVDDDIAELDESLDVALRTWAEVAALSDLVASFHARISDNDVADVLITSVGNPFPWFEEHLDLEVRLAAAPQRDVPVEFFVTGDDLPWQPDSGWVAPATVVFSPEDWDEPRRVRMGIEWSYFYNESRRNLNWRTRTEDRAYGALAPRGTLIGSSFIDDIFFVHPVAGAWPESVFAFEGGPPTRLYVRADCQQDVRLEWGSSRPDTVAFSDDVLTAVICSAMNPTSTEVIVKDGTVDDHAWVGVALNATYSGDRWYTMTEMPGIPMLLVDRDVTELVPSLRSIEVNERLARKACTQLVLSRAPLADVTFDVVASDATEATASVTTLRYRSADWYVPQEVCVTAEDDDVPDGTQSAPIRFGPALSADAQWAGVRFELPVRVTDDETDGITIFRKETPVWFEHRYRYDRFAWLLPNTRTTPSAYAQIASSNPSRVAGFGSGFGEWLAIAQRPETDDVVQPAEVISFDLTVTGSPMSVASLEVVLLDLSGARKIRSTSPQVSVGQGSDTTELVLAQQPMAPVTIPLTSSDPLRYSVSPDTLLFDSTNWDVPQTVTVTANMFEFRNERVLVGPAVSADPSYDGEWGWSLSIH